MRHKIEDEINKKTNYKGVFWAGTFKKAPWSATIKAMNGKVNLGNFSSDILAAQAYDEAVIRYLGEKAKLNFPKDRGNLVEVFKHNRKVLK